MLVYTLRRLLLAIPTLFGISVITFLIVAAAPGDPAALQMEGADPKHAASAKTAQLLREHFELDRPLPERYWRWLTRTVRGNFGNSFQDHRPVLPKIAEKLPATITLSVLSMAIAFLIAIPTGMLAASWRNGWFDRLSAIALYALYALPSYVMAICLIALLGGILPTGGMTSDGFSSFSWLGKAGDLALHFLLITACFAYPGLAADARFTRQNLLEVVRQDYIRTARAKGVGGVRIMVHHAFRNSLIPLVTRLGLLFPAIMSGSVILEVIFNWPGIGRTFYEAVMARDHPLVMAMSVITAMLVLVGTLLADLAYAYVDPRISYA